MTRADAGADRGAPGIGDALGLIALYFVLQVVAGGAVAWVVALAEGFHGTHAGLAGMGTAIRSALRHPGMQAAVAATSLLVATSMTVLVARYRWRSCWSSAEPAGLGFTSPRSRHIALALLLGLLLPVAGGQLTRLLAGSGPVVQDIAELGASAPSGWRMLLAVTLVSAGPLAEELLFRGVLLSALRSRLGTGVAILGSSVAFALLHLPGLQFQWFALPDLLLLALVLAWLRLRCGSIWPSVLAHAVNNLVAVAAWFALVAAAR